MTPDPATPAPDYWVLCFEGLPDDERALPIRIRQLLKLARRTCGLRCVAVRDPTAAEAKRIAERGEVEKKGT